METVNVPGDGVYAVIRPTFSPESYDNLTTTAAKALIPQMKAAPHIENAFLKMLDGDRNAQRWNFIKKVAPHGNQAIKDYGTLYYFFGSPWLAQGDFSQIPRTELTDTAFTDAMTASGDQFSLKKEYNAIKEDLLNPESLPASRPLFLNLVRYNGKRVSADKEAHVKGLLLAKKGELSGLSQVVKDAKHHPLLQWDTVLNVTDGGRVEPTRYIDAFTDLAPAAELYLEAAGIASADYPNYGYFLAKTGRALIDGNNFDGLDLMLVKNDSPLVTITGPIEQYVALQRDRELPLEKAGLQITHAIRSEEETARLKAFEDKLPALIKTVPSDFRNLSTPRISMQVVDVIFNGAESARFGKTYMGQNLPNDQWNNKIAPVIFSYDSSIVQKTAAVHSAIADQIMSADQRASMDVLGAERNIVKVHELGHTLGVRTIYRPHLEEAKAEAVSIRHADVAGVEGKALDQVYLNFPMDMIRTVRLGITSDLKNVEGAHAIASNILLNIGYAYDGILVENGVFSVDRANLNRGFDFFLSNAYPMAHAGKMEPIETFIKEWNAVNNRTASAIQKLQKAGVPKEIIAIYEDPDIIIKKLEDHLSS